MAKPSLDDLLKSVRDPKADARKAALSKVPVSKTPNTKARRDMAQANQFSSSLQKSQQAGVKADSLAAQQNKANRAKALRQRAIQLKREKRAGADKEARIKAGLDQAKTGGGVKIASGSSMSGDAGGYGGLLSRTGKTVGGLGKAAVAATGLDKKLETKKKAVAQRMFAKDKNRGLRTGVSKPSAKPAAKPADPWKSNKPKDPWKEEYLWEVDSKREDQEKLIKPMTGKNKITVNPNIKEEAVSRKQQRFFGMIRAAQKGEMKNPSPEVAKAAATMKKKDVKDFASTKHKGLPEKKETKESFTIDPKAHRGEQRAKKIRTLSVKGSTEGEREAAKRKTKGPALFGEGLMTIEDSDGNVMAQIMDFTAIEIIEGETKKCKDGHYWCNTDKKCKKIPTGWHVGRRGIIEKDDENEESESKSKEGTSGGNGNGSNGGTVSERKTWSRKYKDSIDCDNPKGFSQKAYCAGRKKKIQEGSKSGDDSLRDWFTKSRSSDGTPGWVQLGGKYAGKPCAKQPGQTTKPKCGSSKMKRDLNKDEEEKAFRRKNAEDPNPNRKGKAKNVATESKDHEVAMAQSQLSSAEKDIKALKKKLGKKEKDIPAWMQAKITDTEHNMDAAAGYATNEEKDACYRKVKSRYSVWPSAYASGALVKCRKAGAANWGNKTKKEEYEMNTWERVQEACWKGYTQKGMKKKGNRVVPNCVKEQNKVQSTGQAADPSTITFPSGLQQRIVPGSTVIRDVDTKPKSDPKKKFNQTLNSVGSALSKNPLTMPKESYELDEGRIVRAAIRAIDKTKPAPQSRRGRIRSALVRAEIEDTTKKNKKRKFSGLAASEKASKSDRYMSPASQTTAPVKEGYDKPDEKLRTDRDGYRISKKDADDAKARLLAKAKAKRAMKEGVLEEGMSLKDFKKKRSAQKQKEKRADEKTSPLRRAGIHDDKSSPERDARHRANVDPDFDGDDSVNYPGGKLKNPKKIRKAKALGELGESTVVHKMGGVVMGKTKTADGKDTVKVDDAPVSKSTYDFIQKKGMNKVDSSGKPTADTTYDERKAAGLKTVKKVNEIFMSAPAPKKQDPKKNQKKETWYDRDERKRKERKEEVEHLGEMPYQVYGSPDGKKEKKIGKPVKSKKYADARAAELADTHKKTGGKYRYEYTEEAAAWTRKAGKNKEGGLNEKGRKSYERENPGSDLKAPSKEVGNKRRASFCARMSGMKKKLTSKKTANDPDSRINKSLRAWNC